MEHREQLLLEVRRYLTDTLHYGDREADRVVEQVSQMDERVQQWLWTWRQEGVYPSEPVEQVTVRELVDNLEMEPVSAFLAADWLLKQPEEAKYALSRPWHALEITEEVRRALLEGDAPSHE